MEVKSALPCDPTRIETFGKVPGHRLGVRRRSPRRRGVAARPPIPPPPPVETEDLKPVPLGKASDEELMRRTQQEDKQAFELLYERYSASVLSYLYRMLGNLEDVESIGQEVFLRAFRFRADLSLPP